MADQDKASIEYAIGIDVGGTKIAAGLVRLSDGVVLARRHAPTEPERGGARVLDDVIEMAKSLTDEAAALDQRPGAIGIGLAELVSPRGEVLSAATIDWTNLRPLARVAAASSLPALLEADVRAAALAESRYGAGRARQSFLYVTIGTGISAALVIDGVPFTGARGLTGTFASAPLVMPLSGGNVIDGPPLERHASGSALAERLRESRPYFTGGGRDVLSLAEDDDADAEWIVRTGGEALGAAIAQLVNMLDPEIVVLGGGLGATEGAYRASVERSMRRLIWSDLHRDVQLLTAELGVEAGVVGAAACCGAKSR